MIMSQMMAECAVIAAHSLAIAQMPTNYAIEFWRIQSGAYCVQYEQYIVFIVCMG